MSGSVAVLPKVQFCSATGVPLVDGTVTVYLAGTVTPTNTWQDSDLSILNTNPIELDARGECLLWLDPALTYKFLLKNASGVEQWTVDDVASVDTLLRQDLAAAGGAGLIGFSHSSSYAAGSVGDKLKDIVSVKDAPYNAVGDGVTDDLAAFNAALLAAKCVHVPAGTYKISGTIALTQTGNALIGEGLRLVTITSTSASLPNITLATGVANFQVQGMVITKSVAGTSGGDGIKCIDTTTSSTLRNLEITNCYNGLAISTCDEGLIENVICRANWQNGIRITNSVGYGPAQWKMNGVLASINALDGIRVEVTDGPAGLILGTWQNIETFGNSGIGVNLIGSSTTPIYDLRINQGFIGGDNGGGIRLDTYGGKHRIVSCFVELSGTSGTGPTLSTPASNAADGIEVTANNADCGITSCTIDQNSENGIRHGGGILSVGGCNIYNNGAALTAGLRNGIISTGGRLVVSGSFLTNISTVFQEYGIATNHASVVVTGNDMTGNVTSAYTLGAAADQNTVILGNAQFGTFQHAGTVVYDLIAQNIRTPGLTNIAADSINVAGDVYKNGTAYTNP
jgi:hypothetical protein